MLARVPRDVVEDERAFKRSVEARCREYFSHGSTEELELSVRETLVSAREREGASGGVSGVKTGLEAHVVKRLIACALDRGARERELVARALRTLRERETLDGEDLERGFDRVLAEMADLRLDFPDAAQECVTFLARAVMDEVVSVTYLESACSRDGYGEGRDVAQRAKRTLEDVGGEERVRKAWGGPEGYNASSAKVEMRDIIDEYLVARDGAEAERRVRRLNMPFYHHEFVKMALTLALEQSVLMPNMVEKVVDLLKYLGKSSLVNGSQMAKGFARTATTLKDVSIDVPKAPEIFGEIVERSKRAGLLPTGLSAWASLKPAALGGGSLRGKGALLRLDSAPDLVALARATSKSPEGSPGSSRSASPAPYRNNQLNRSVSPGLTRMGSATRKQINVGWSGLRAQSAAKNLKPTPRAQGVDANGSLIKSIPIARFKHLFRDRIEFKPEGRTQNKLGLKRTNSAPGGLDELDTTRFVRPVGLVHDYRPFLEKYQLLQQIGSGGFAVVHRAKHLATGEIVAVKTLHVEGLGHDSDADSDSDSSSSSDDSSDEDEIHAMTLHDVQRELVMMQQLSMHPNIVTIREFFTEHDDHVVHVVMDILEGPELDDLVNERAAPFPEDEVKVLMSAMLDAVAFMHGKGVIHRDLKLENFVLAKKGDLKSLNIVDFGLAKALNARQKAQHVCGTLSYIAPEALLAGVYGQGVDVWALGIAMHVLLTHTWPFDDDDEDELYEQIVECDLDFDTEAWDNVSEEAKDLIQGLLDPNPKRRLTAAQALEHSWFTGQATHTSNTLHNMHARLESLISITRQPPERRFKDGDFITRQGDPAKEYFIITSGECTLRRDDVVVGVRRAGNFVGELRNLEMSDGDGTLTAWTSARAVGEVRALVFQDKDVDWAYQFDYRLTSEFESMIRRQRKLLAKEAREQRKREVEEKRTTAENEADD